MPAGGDALTAREVVMRVGAFLVELTADRPTVAVHAEIVAQLSEPDHDRRLDGVAGAVQFMAMWTALRDGSSLPADGWQSVVLPTVITFSAPNELKARLESATSQWMTANAAVNGPPRTLAVAGGGLPEPELEPVDVTVLSAAEGESRRPAQPSAEDIIDAHLGPGAGRRHRTLIVSTVAVALIAAALVWWIQAHRVAGDNRLSPPPPIPAGDSGQPASASPDTSAQATPTVAQPVGNPNPTPLSTQPVPTPTWNGPGPIAAPTAPQSLAVIDTTETTIALSWQPPADAGTGGLAYYRVWRDGTSAGWTTQTSATVTGLTPATAYTFTVTAHNATGAASPASNPVTATTRPPRPSLRPPPPPTGPPVGSPTLAASPPNRPIELGRSFTITGMGWPCVAPSTINLYLGGRLVATPAISGQGSFRTTIAVDASQPDTPTVAVIGGSEPVTLTVGFWLVAAQLPAQPSCTATADQSIQIEFRNGPG